MLVIEKDIFFALNGTILGVVTYKTNLQADHAKL